ncbi:hypothetical protein ACXWTF_02580 [Thiomicrolovo sp. ZZH C-3]
MIYLEIISEIVKSTASFAITGFSLYFAWQKLFNKVEYQYTITTSVGYPVYISNVLLLNKKNKPLTIFKLYALVDNHIHIQLEKFDIPLILKPLESSNISLQPVSFYTNYKLSFKSKILIVIETNHGLINCKKLTHETVFTTPNIIGAATRNTYNGVIYSPDHIYAINVALDNRMSTILITRDGGVTNDEDELRFFAALPDYCLTSVNTLKEYIINNSPLKAEQIQVESLQKFHQRYS